MLRESVRRIQRSMYYGSLSRYALCEKWPQCYNPIYVSIEICIYKAPLKAFLIAHANIEFWCRPSTGNTTDRQRKRRKKMVKMDKMLISKPLVHINLLAHLKWKRRVFALSLGSAICRFALDFILFLSGIQLKRYILAAATRSNMYTSNQHQFWIFALKTDLH